MAIAEKKVIEPPLRKSLINTILKRLLENLDVVKVVLFGSYVSGKPTKDSDLDLLIIVNTKKKGIKRYAMVSEILEPRKIPMDIIVKTPEELKNRIRMFDPFIRNILKTGKVLYEKPA